ncbi:protein GAMETE EXPRESSED 1-like [Phragmites australis]|uniref:protein GAMETE EXPRESSED 1-like n=1 Tax=Phragmites australis TaxID=29695 RepID=UPI002D78627E|nr:protein GAMETE EXPRESSED 1-like [Phragmites australis]XP_062198604.1 protein GAMETE EXPRESSED 1-like [Phragmites australis]
MTRNAWFLLLILTCLLICPRRSSGFSWNIFSSFSSSAAATGGKRAPMMELDGAVADFSIDGANDPRGAKLLENARGRLAGPRNCWQEAYRKLFASCGDIMADKERQSRLAWHLTSCFQEDSGRPPFPSCSESSKMVHCRKRLSDSEGKVFLEFFLETNTLCHQLQAEAFKHNTERLVNDLTRTSKSAEEKLEVIEERSDQIIKESGKVQDALSSIETQADHLAETSKNVGVQINDVLAHSKAIFEQSKEIATSQAELREEQTEMREKIDAGMARIEESYESLGNGMDKLKDEASYIQKEIKTVGDSMSSKMQNLQSTADDIGSVAGKSLENQMQLLDGQTRAMEGLNNLHSFQAQALEESRETVQKLAQFSQSQQEELLSRQEQIRQAHDHLIQNSHDILEAQEEFRAKQANIFAALDKLYILHNAILAESRFIKAFFFYCCIVFLIYMLTSAKQTFSIRGQLYFGLCITLMLEIGLIKLGADDFDKQFWVMSKVFLVRMVFLGVATLQILHSIFTYRDYELLNHRLLQTLVEKVRALEQNAGGRTLSYGSGESERSLRDYSWVFDELADEVDSKMDPTYTLPPERARGRCADDVVLPEEVGENSITTSVSRRYNLRSRK